MHVPEGYIPEANLRLSLHKRMASVAAEAELEDLLGEIEGRFGPPPAPLRNLVEPARRRLREEAHGIESLESEGGVPAVEVSQRPRIGGDEPTALLAADRLGMTGRGKGRTGLSTFSSSANLGRGRGAARARSPRG
jgi:transcription-repair coupling factor (superfamily II helicase)